MARPEHGARKRFGQHFLVDEFAIDRIIELIDPRTDDRILEIGPGGGVLTARLVESGARVIAVEIDRDLAAALTQRFAGAGNFTLNVGDILKFDFELLDPGAGPWKVAGNLPYNISTPLIMRLLEESARVSCLTLMVQKEVAERLVAAPGSKAYGRLSVMAQHRCSGAIMLEIGPDSFRPPPKVDSCVVQLHPLGAADEPGFETWFAEIVRAAFSARRKTIANALRGCVDRTTLEACGVSPGARAEELGVADFVRLARATLRRGTVTHNSCG